MRVWLVGGGCGVGVIDGGAMWVVQIPTTRLMAASQPLN